MADTDKGNQALIDRLGLDAYMFDIPTGALLLYIFALADSLDLGGVNGQAYQGKRAFTMGDQKSFVIGCYLNESIKGMDPVAHCEAEWPRDDSEAWGTISAWPNLNDLDHPGTVILKRVNEKESVEMLYKMREWAAEHLNIVRRQRGLATLAQSPREYLAKIRAQFPENDLPKLEALDTMPGPLTTEAAEPTLNVIETRTEKGGWGEHY